MLIFLGRYAQNLAKSIRKPQTSNLKPQTSNLKPQTSNLKSQISNLKPKMVLSEATRPTSHIKIKKRCTWKKGHETLTLGKRLRGQPEKKEEKIHVRTIQNSQNIP